MKNLIILNVKMTLLNDMAAAIINGDIKKIAYLNLQIRNDDLDL